jgi:hypothetical protein
MQPARVVVKRGEPPIIPLPEAITVDVVVLPLEVDQDGTGLYSDSALMLVKELRSLEIQAQYQHPQDSRTWVGERSFAAVAFEWILGVSSNAGWAALCLLLRRKGKASVRIKLARCTQSGSETVWEWAELEGDGTAIADALERIGFAGALESQDEEEADPANQ